MGKFIDGGLLTPEDTKDWDTAIVGQPVAGPGSPGRPPPGPVKKQPVTSDEKAKEERKR